MARITANFSRSDNSVFVKVEPPEKYQQAITAESQPRVWAKVASEIASSTEAPTETPTETKPTAEELLAETLPKLIAATRWGRYIVPGPASRVFDGTVFVYHNPCENFWDLYNLSKGIFKDLGILLTKVKGTIWEARIPIGVLTDKMFFESGLASVEKVLMASTGIDPSKVLSGIRKRQFAATKSGMSKVKRMREGIADAVGLLAITAIGWAAYVVMGVC